MTLAIIRPASVGVTPPRPAVIIKGDNTAEAGRQAAIATLAANSATAAGRYFVNQAAGEAGSTTGQFFSHPDGAGGLLYRERTGGGSIIIAYAATKAQIDALEALLDHSVERFGAVLDGTTDDTAAIQAALDSGFAEITMGPGTTVVTGLTHPDGVTLRGAGRGVSIIYLADGSDTHVIASATGASGCGLFDLTIDGNDAGQASPGHGFVGDGLTNSAFDRVEVKNARGTGIVISGGGGNTFGPGMNVHGNGALVAGYGLYLYCSDDNHVDGGIYDDNCIGIAVEASGAGQTAHRNRIVTPLCRNNRADFGQSGAGVHFELSAGGEGEGNVLVGPVCTGSTGVGINNTAMAVQMLGGIVSNNDGAGVTTLAANGFAYIGIDLLDNSTTGGSAPYRTEMRFDDSGLNPASSGLVASCRMRGSAPDGGVRTLSTNSAVIFRGNDVSGYSVDYSTASTADRVDQSDTGSFTMGITGLITTPTATAKWSIDGNIVTLQVPQLLGTSNTTACTLTGLPAAIRPVAARETGMGWTGDNSSNHPSSWKVETDGTITLRWGLNSAFTAGGTKGAQACTIIYSLRG